MPLVTVESLNEILASPCCRAELESRRCSGCGRTFAATGPWPILVDFDDSVLELGAIAESEGKSPVSRSQYRGVKAVVRRVLKVHNRVAEVNLAALLGRLSAGARVLVVGGGAIGDGMDQLYAAHTEVALVGFDIYGSENVQLIADAHRIPFVKATFDAVVIQAVLSTS